MPRVRAALVLLLLAGPVFAGDWPQWLGPKRDGSSPEMIAPWTSAPRVVWRKPVGEGNGGPVVVDGRVVVQTKVAGKNEEEIVAFDAATGNELWRTPYKRPEFKSLYGNGPRSTPAIVDGKVFAMGITDILTALDLASGKVLWQTDVLKELHATNLFFGSSVSPLVEGGHVYVMAGGAGGALAAFSAATGKVEWKDAEDHASYSSPIAWGEGKNRQIFFLAQSGVVALEPGDGKVLWRIPLVDKLFESSTTPALCGDLLFASSITFGSLGIHLENKAGQTKGSELWKNPDLTCYFATPVASGTEYLYVVTGTKPGSRPTTATLNCVEAKTGKVLWKKPKVGTYHATLMRLGDGKMLLLEEPGNLALFEPDPKEYRQLARAKVCGNTWVHPALANGRLFVRDDKELICLDFSK